MALVLLISGLNDRAWPSSLYSCLAASTLAKAWHPERVVHLDFENAGHSINFPFVPTTQTVRQHPLSKVPFTSGGNAFGKCPGRCRFVAARARSPWQPPANCRGPDLAPVADTANTVALAL